MGRDNLSVVQSEPKTDVTQHGLSIDHRDALLVLGHVFFQHHQSDKALMLFEALHLLFPKDIHVRLSLAYAHLINGHYGRALELAEQCHGGKETMFNKKTSSRTLIKICALWALSRKDEARQQFQNFINGRNPL